MPDQQPSTFLKLSRALVNNRVLLQSNLLAALFPKVKLVRSPKCGGNNSSGLDQAGPKHTGPLDHVGPNCWTTLDHAGPRLFNSLIYNDKKPTPTFTFLRGCKPLFLLAKTLIADSCMKCVKNMRFKGPMLTPMIFSQPTHRNFIPASNAAALALLFIISSHMSVNADGWSKTGSFTLSGGATATALSSSDWNLPVVEWQASRNFEMATPGHTPNLQSQITIQGGSSLAQLLSLISQAESPRRQYNAVHHGAKTMPPALPTALTVGDVFQWIRATPRQNHAIGRYQIIPSTLAYLVEAENIPLNTRFDEALQDRLAFRLIKDAGWDKFKAGQLSRSGFMDALAGVWAGLPKANGRSVYHGYAGNRATITRASYETAFAQIFR